MIAVYALASLCLTGLAHSAGVTIAHPSPLVAREAYGYAEAPAVAVAAAHAEHYAPVLPTVEKTQYHAQDELGQYAYGYSEPNQIKEERKFYDGTVIGSYSYNSPDGRVVTNNYVADDHGFRSNLAPTLHKDNTVAVAEEAAKVAALTDAYRSPIYADAYGAPGYYAPAASAVVEKSYPHAPYAPAETLVQHAPAVHAPAPVHVARQAYAGPAPHIVEKAYASPAPAVYASPAPAVVHHQKTYVAASPAPAVHHHHEETYVSASPAPYVASPAPYAPAAAVVKTAVHSEPAPALHYAKSYSAGPAHHSQKEYVKQAGHPVTHVEKSYHHRAEHHAAPVAVHHNEYIAVSPAPVVHAKEYVAVSPAPYAAHEAHAAPSVHVKKEYGAHTAHGPANIIHKEYHEPSVVAKSAYVDPHHGVAHEQAYIKPGVTVRKTVVDPLPRTVAVKKSYRADPYHSSHHEERHVVDPAPQVHVEKTYSKPAVAHTERFHGPYGDAHARTYVEPGHVVKKAYRHQAGPSTRHVEVHRSGHARDPYGPAVYAARKYGGYHSHRPRFYRRGPARHYRAYRHY